MTDGELLEQVEDALDWEASKTKKLLLINQQLVFSSKERAGVRRERRGQLRSCVALACETASGSGWHGSFWRTAPIRM